MEPSPTTPLQDAATIRRLRRGVGTVGMALPFVLVIGDSLIERRFTLLGSISGYYYTGMRDVFVGGVCAIGVFLICYRYQRVDDVLATIAGLLAIAVALLPVTPDPRTTTPTPTSTDRAIGLAHMLCAAALFLVLAIFCLFVFTRKDPAGCTRRKRVRNAIYYLCGIIILAAIGLAIASHLRPNFVDEPLRPLFWCETVAILAFGAAWLVKGETLFRDEVSAINTTQSGPAPALVSSPG